MAISGDSRVSLRVQIFEDGEPKGSPMTLVGREAWAMRLLIKSTEGVSSLDHVGPRLSHYIFKLRGYGFSIETIHTKHDGPFPGSHAVYRNHSDVRVLEDNTGAAVAA